MNDKMKKAVILVVSCLLAFGAGGMWASQRENKGDEVPHHEDVIKDEDFSREGALNVATEMLQEAYKLDAKRYVDKLLSGEKIDMPKTITDRYHIPKGNPHDSEIEELTDLSILIMINTLKELDFEEVKVNNKYAEDLVYFDKEARLASIPYHIYTGLPENTGFTIQLGYINGEWKYLPYEQIQKMALATSIGMQEAENE